MTKSLKHFPFHFQKKWYLLIILAGIFINGQSQSKKTSASIKGYGSASYTVNSSSQFMRDWLIAGPLLIKTENSANPDDQTQTKFFKETDPGVITVESKKVIAPLMVRGETLSWKSYFSGEDIIDLDRYFQNKDFACAYALAEIKADNEKKIMMAFGSDDGIKVFHNGKLVHDNWVPRALLADEDLVPISLVKGSNQIVIKVQDMQGGWGFTSRILDDNSMTDKLVQTAGKGNIDELTTLISAGANVNGKGKRGLTPLNAAILHGRSDVVQLLKQNGATESPMPPAAHLAELEYADLQGKKAAGISILIAQNGNVIYKNGFGYADIEKDQRVTPETKFRIGSITKQFIGAAILKLQEDGKISVKDKLSKYIPDFPKGDQVTVHHLLTHTSGIHSFTNKHDFIQKVTSPISEDELVSQIKKDAYDFEPGERFLYNNSGYFLLGYIIHRVTGKTYGEYLKEQFFIPLGMTNTGVHEATLKLANEAKGYKKENGQYNADINWDMSWAGGAGALYSTVDDLFKWNEAIFNGKLLKPESLQAAFTPVVLNSGQSPVEGKYGYGWFIGNYRGQETVGHGGGLHGFSTRILRFPKENLSVIMLTNVIPTEVTLSPEVIAEYFIWEKLEPQPSFSIAKGVSENVSQYEGRYDFGQGIIMIVTSENNNLFAQLTNQPKFPIFPSAPGEYFWRVVDAKVKFIKNENGEVTHGDFSQGGANLKVMKLKDEIIVEISPSILDYYIGKYDLGNDQVTISKENNRLYAQTNTSPRFEVKALSEKEFTISELNARITFIRDGDQKAGKFILDMGGQKKDVPRIE
jgi:CubicO group peptidase (beta-lactamase class C family)